MFITTPVIQQKQAFPWHYTKHLVINLRWIIIDWCLQKMPCTRQCRAHTRLFHVYFTIRHRRVNTILSRKSHLLATNTPAVKRQLKRSSECSNTVRCTYFCSCFTYSKLPLLDLISSISTRCDHPSMYWLSRNRFHSTCTLRVSQDIILVSFQHVWLLVKAIDWADAFHNLTQYMHCLMRVNTDNNRIICNTYGRGQTA